jgi:hypothetical protein
MKPDYSFPTQDLIKSLFVMINRAEGGRKEKEETDIQSCLITVPDEIENKPFETIEMNYLHILFAR